jgi:hypothetical protein
MRPRTAGAVRFATIVLLGYALQATAKAQSENDIAATVRACQLVAELSARLACYDRAFPPLAGSAPEPGAPAAAAATQGSAGAARAAAAPSPPTPPEQAPRWEAARIVEVESPDLRTTIFHAEDGRVFVRQDATSVIQWPDTPFDVEVQTSFLRTSTYLKLPGRGPRVRVTLRD